MNEFHRRATTRTESTPQSVFNLVTDIDRLPDWNAAIESVMDAPSELIEGAE